MTRRTKLLALLALALGTLVGPLPAGATDCDIFDPPAIGDTACEVNATPDPFGEPGFYRAGYGVDGTLQYCTPANECIGFDDESLVGFTGAGKNNNFDATNPVKYDGETKIGACISGICTPTVTVPEYVQVFNPVESGPEMRLWVNGAPFDVNLPETCVELGQDCPEGPLPLLYTELLQAQEPDRSARL